MSTRESPNNVPAAVCSVFVPGLGQLVQGRILPAFLFFAAWITMWCFCLGFIPHFWSVIDAAVWRPKGD
jgi:TM2 domain-containing membrane protein YozV